MVNNEIWEKFSGLIICSKSRNEIERRVNFWVDDNNWSKSQINFLIDELSKFMSFYLDDGLIDSNLYDGRIHYSITYLNKVLETRFKLF